MTASVRIAPAAPRDNDYSHNEIVYHHRPCYGVDHLPAYTGNGFAVVRMEDGVATDIVYMVNNHTDANLRCEWRRRWGCKTVVCGMVYDGTVWCGKERVRGIHIFKCDTNSYGGHGGYGRGMKFEG